MEWTRQVAALQGWAFEEWYGAPPRLLANVRFPAAYWRGGLVGLALAPSAACKRKPGRAPAQPVPGPRGETGDLDRQPPAARPRAAPT
jgi:hypothetical protein